MQEKNEHGKATYKQAYMNKRQVTKERNVLTEYREKGKAIKATRRELWKRER